MINRGPKRTTTTQRRIAPRLVAASAFAIATGVMATGLAVGVDDRPAAAGPGGLSLEVIGHECRSDAMLGDYPVVSFTVASEESFDIDVALWANGQQINGRQFSDRQPGDEHSAILAYEGWGEIYGPSDSFALTAHAPGIDREVTLDPPDCPPDNGLPTLDAAVGFENDSPEPGSDFVIHVRCGMEANYNLELSIDGYETEVRDGITDLEGRDELSIPIPADAEPGTPYSVYLYCFVGAEDPIDDDAGASGTLGGAPPPETEVDDPDPVVISPVPGPVTDGDAQVVAQGIVAFGDEPVVWDHLVVEAGELPLDFAGGPAMFFIADGPDAVLVADGDGSFALLDEGEAVFVAEGVTGSAAPLVEELTAGMQRLMLAPGTGEASFAPGDGQRDVNLIRHVFAPGEEVGIASPFPVGVVVTEGEITEASGAVLAAEGGLETMGTTLQLVNDSDEPATVLIAAVGGEVP